MAGAVLVAQALDTDPHADAEKPPGLERVTPAPEPTQPSDTYSLNGFNEGIWRIALAWIALQAELDAATPPPPHLEPTTHPEPDGAWTGRCGALPDHICARESGFNPGAVSPGGTYMGKYQFLQSTWDNAAASMGRTDLVGIPPHLVSEADQDAVAAHLWAGGAGCSHWNAC